MLTIETADLIKLQNQISAVRRKLTSDPRNSDLNSRLDRLLAQLETDNRSIGPRGPAQAGNVVEPSSIYGDAYVGGHGGGAVSLNDRKFDGHQWRKTGICKRWARN